MKSLSISIIASVAFGLAAATSANAFMAFTSSKELNLRAGPGEEFAIIGVMERDVRVNMTGCVDDYTWCLVTVDGLVGWAFARSIVVELARCYRTAIKEHKDIKLRTAVERLANRLLRYHQDQGARGNVELPYDKRLIASMLGMTPENLSRAFNTLKPYGVDVQGSCVSLSDISSLTRLAKPNPLIDDRDT